MRLAWLTDIHLNFVDDIQRRGQFLESVKEQSDAVTVSGDIGESHDVVKYLWAAHIALRGDDWLFSARVGWVGKTFRGFIVGHRPMQVKSLLPAKPGGGCPSHIGKGSIMAVYRSIIAVCKGKEV